MPPPPVDAFSKNLQLSKSFFLSNIFVTGIKACEMYSFFDDNKVCLFRISEQGRIIIFHIYDAAVCANRGKPLNLSISKVKHIKWYVILIGLHFKLFLQCRLVGEYLPKNWNIFSLNVFSSEYLVSIN